MDDTFKGLLFGFLGMIVIHGSLEKRVNHDANQQVREAFHETGTVITRAESRGVFGVFGNKIFSIDVYGEGQKTDRLPFLSYPREGWKGSIRHLRLHFTHLTLRGLPVQRFEADIPNVTYDLGRALYQHSLVVRGAGTGPAMVRIDADGLRIFILRKYEKTLSDVKVSLENNKLIIEGNLKVFGAPAPFVATGSLLPRAGRYLDLVQPDITLNGKPLAPPVAGTILKQINPVLDVDLDLGLGGYFTLASVAIEQNEMVVRGSAAIPLAPEESPR